MFALKSTEYVPILIKFMKNVPISVARKAFGGQFFTCVGHEKF